MQRRIRYAKYVCCAPNETIFVSHSKPEFIHTVEA